MAAGAREAQASGLQLMKHILRIAVVASAAALLGIHYFPERRAAQPVAPAAKPAVAAAPKPDAPKPVVPKPDVRKPAPEPASAQIVERPSDTPDASRLYTLPSSQSYRPPGRHGPTPARALPTD